MVDNKIVLIELRGRMCNQIIEFIAACSDLHKQYLEGKLDNIKLEFAFSFNKNTDARSLTKGFQYLLDSAHIIPVTRPINVEDIYQIYTGYNQKAWLIDANIMKNLFFDNNEGLQNILRLKYPGIENSVVLHVRRGDYIDEEHRDRYYSITPDYVKKVWDKHFSDMKKLIVISDDIDWCEKNIKLDGVDITFARDTEPIEDLFTMALAKGTICSGSTFSVIGSMLGHDDSKKHVMHEPYDRMIAWKSMELVPDYFIKEQVTESMENYKYL